MPSCARDPPASRSSSTWQRNLPAGSLPDMGIVEVGDRAPDPVVLDTRGEDVRLSSAWAERTAVLAFLRHFG